MATIYTDFKNGNDGNTGGTSDPLKTLTHALTHANNNDTIRCRGSDAADEIYREYAKTTALTGLTIMADTGHTPTFTPAIEYTVWVLTGGQNFTYETAFTPFACWCAWNGTTALVAKASIIEVEATADTFWADVVNDKLYVHIAGGGAPTAIQGWATVDALLTSAGAGIAYSGIRCQWCSAGFSIKTAGNATGCTIRYHQHYGGNRHCINVETAAAVNVTNCILSGTYGSAEGTIGINQAAGAATLTVTGCTFTSMRYGYYQHDRGGILAFTNCTFTLCHDCITADDISVGVTATIAGCTAYDFGHGAYQLTGVRVTATLTNCLAYVPAGATLTNLTAFIAEISANCTFYNCLAVGALGSGFYILANTVATVKNCAAINCVAGFHKDIAVLTADYNGVHGNATAYDNWAAGAHDVSSDPLFVDEPAYDYHLTALSPWRDAGVDVGLPYSGLAPDIGVFEYATQGGHRNKYGLLSSRILTA